MPEQIHITAHCIISNHAIYKNSISVFEAPTSNVSDFLTEAYRYLNIGYARFYKMDQLSKLGLLAVEVLIKDSFEAGRYRSEEVGMVLSNASASLDSDLCYMETMDGIPSPSLFVYTLPNIMIGEICIKHQFRGENAFFVSSRFDESFIHGYVSILFKDELVRVCICGWVELLDESYKAILYLVEKSVLVSQSSDPAEMRLPVTISSAQKEQLLFSVDNLRTLFAQQISARN